jgi:hypothetical protein
MPGVFISYRRSDSRGTTGRLYDFLKQRLSPVQVFRDIYDLRPGEKYEDAIQRALASSGVLLAIIGPGWLNASDATGRRLNDPTDLLRREIATALASNIPVIPVLVDGANMPAARDLPHDLHQLSALQSIKLSDDSWDHDADRLLKAIAAILGIRLGSPDRTPGRTPQPPAPSGNQRRGFVAGITGLMLFAGVLIIGGLIVIRVIWPVFDEIFKDITGPEAAIALSRSSGPAGTSLTIDGEGFRGGETVIIRFHTQEVRRVTADDQGAFTNVQVQVPPDWIFKGQFDFIAQGNSSIETATMPFQVT